MYKKNLSLQIFFIILALLSLLRLYDNASNLDAWQFGEWLINYEGGFVRRGIPGEFFYQIHNLTAIHLGWIAFVFVIAMCVLYIRPNFYFENGAFTFRLVPPPDISK